MNRLWMDKRIYGGMDGQVNKWMDKTIDREINRLPDG